MNLRGALDWRSEIPHHESDAAAFVATPNQPLNKLDLQPATSFLSRWNLHDLYRHAT
jgi:hypothetical protein